MFATVLCNLRALLFKVKNNHGKIDCMTEFNYLEQNMAY